MEQQSDYFGQVSQFPISAHVNYRYIYQRKFLHSLKIYANGVRYCYFNSAQYLCLYCQNYGNNDGSNMQGNWSDYYGYSDVSKRKF